MMEMYAEVWLDVLCRSVCVCVCLYLSISFVCLFAFLRANRYRVTNEGGGVIGRRRQRKKSTRCRRMGGLDGRQREATRM